MHTWLFFFCVGVKGFTLFGLNVERQHLKDKEYGVYLIYIN
jgi:hypothetical protein